MRSTSRCRCGGGRRCDCGDCGCGCGRGCRCGCGCGCGCDGGFKRRHQTKTEQSAELEKYLKDLEAEVQAVREKLADLKRKKR
jgi:hypothetical protein